MTESKTTKLKHTERSATEIMYKLVAPHERSRESFYDRNKVAWPFWQPLKILHNIGTIELKLLYKT